MRRRAAGWSGLVAVVAVAACAVGCGPPRKVAPRRSPTFAQDQSADDDARLDWATQDPWLVVVRKSCRTLDVYRYGIRVGSYPAVFGLGGSGSKLYQGDMRTPTGLYQIVDSRPHPRWDRFLLLDYPNPQDLHEYWAAMERGDVPFRGDHYAYVGGDVGIHGTDKPELNSRGEDWTWGCISLSNADIEDLAALVPVGTLVLIEE